MTWPRLAIAVLLASTAVARADDAAITVDVPRGASGDIDLADIVTRLARATAVDLSRPDASLPLKVDGVAGTLTRKLLAAHLGDDVAIAIRTTALRIEVPRARLVPERRNDWEIVLRKLAASVDEAARRRARYGMRALASYRPNDPSRPTICLIHGVNSSAAGFVHMIPLLEAAGFGVVVYDYPYNRALAESAAAFQADWKAFRRGVGETRPWAVVAHSMGALVARSYVEDPHEFGHDVADLILIAPVNQGSNLARGQTVLQLMKGLRATNGPKPSDGLAHLADGLGEAAEDMTPGSAFLKRLNARSRAPGVRYRILAGDVGVLSPSARRQIEDQIGAVQRDRGLLGGLARIATGDLSARLDELTTGTGDGCVSVANTRLDGVSDHVTIHANHAELIRAPLLFPDPGPVVCMPYLLRWLGKDAGTAAPR